MDIDLANRICSSSSRNTPNLSEFHHVDRPNCTMELVQLLDLFPGVVGDAGIRIPGVHHCHDPGSAIIPD